MIKRLNRENFIRSIWFGFFLTILFFLFHLIGLTRHSFWIDELHTYGSSQLPVKELVENRFKAGHLPLYFLFIKYWGYLVGYSETTLRFPSVVFALLSFLAFFSLCRKFLKDNFTFLLALGLFFFHPFVFWASQEARMYSLLILITILSSYTLLLFIENSNRISRYAPTYLIAYSITILVGMNLHMVFVLQIAVHFTYVFFYHRKLLIKHLLGIMLPLIILTPMFLAYSSMQEKYNPGINFKLISPGKALKRMAFIAMGDTQLIFKNQDLLRHIFGVLTSFFFLFFLISAIIYFIKIKKKSFEIKKTHIDTLSTDKISIDSGYSDKDELTILRYSFYWIGIPILIMQLMAIFTYDKTGPTRYYIPMLAPIVIIMAMGCVKWRKHLIMNLARYLFLGTFLVILLLQLNWKGVGVREGIKFLKGNYRGNDGVVYCSDGALSYSFSFYNADEFNRMGLSKDLLDKKILLERVEKFAQGKKRIWLILYREDKSPLVMLLKEHPELFKQSFEKEIQEVKIQGFEIRDF